VLDISTWADHPGGGVIYSHAGQDCTDVFTAFHSTGAYELMDKFAIGTVEDMAPPAPFEVEARALNAKFVAMGLYKTRCVAE
jgi:cytochrome b involved in lipid metabolism